MKRYFLIDYENVHEKGLYDIEKLKGKDHVYIYYSENDKIPLWIIQLKGKKFHIKLKKRSGESCSNALDFMLTEKVGELCQKYKKHSIKIVIISNDKGYLAIKEQVSRRQSISFCKNIHDYLKPQLNSFAEEIRPILDNLNFGSNTHHILKLSEQTKSKEDFLEAVNNTFPSKKYKTLIENQMLKTPIKTEFQNIYLKKLARLNLGAHKEIIKEMILSSATEKELEIKMKRKYPEKRKGIKYFQMLKTTKAK